MPATSETRMELTPNDIRNLEFANSLRGYDKDAVDTFKEQVARALETVKQENVKLNMELESLRIQVAGIKQFEDTIKSAAIDSRRNADMLLANARKEAEQLVTAAKAEAEKLMASRSDRMHDIEQRLQNLDLVRKSYVAKLRGMIQSHMELVNEIARESATPMTTQLREHRREDNIDITESTEVRRAMRETVATQPSTSDAPVLEEANAAGNIIAAVHQATEEIQSLTKTLRGEDDPSVDPELAAALENYNKVAQSQGADGTKKRAKDTQPIPISENALGRVTTINNEQVLEEPDHAHPTEEHDSQTEHNSINIDQPIAANPVADSLARELDEVAAKFEEEMDKADKV